MTTTTTVSAAPATTDQFMHTSEFRRHFVDFVPVNALMTLRLATKGWSTVADTLIDEGVRSGVMMVHGGRAKRWKSRLKDMRKLVTRVIFLLNITKVGEYACYWAVNLVVVDIPEGIESIGQAAFRCCTSLTTVSFPTTLKSIGLYAFSCCSSLDNVDLLHTNLQEIGELAFSNCSELKSMTIPDSLQTLGADIFNECYEIAPSIINVNFDFASDPTSDIVAHLRSLQSTP
ncbi:hypothetical protein TrLO_g10861 [Triparma laevis f. longispina]|uniref:Uncharacterized protein n=1 Tax=Triparma laevis f. longispina TaxID=1714387 RepID=A0A9W7CCZ9_9STRA|nr:hypothetical protein TrLO_g10861 [Triparma laevis f. longispina]